MKVLLVVIISVVTLLLVAFLYFKYRLDNISDNKNLMTSVDLEMDKFIKKEEPQAIVLGVYKDSEVLIKGYGQENPGKSTIFQIAFVSKLFTASLLSILCEEKVVKMESTLGELIGKEYPLSPEAKQVTLHQLVTHTAGFPKVPKALMDIVTQKVGKDNLLDNPYSHIKFSDVLNYLETTEGKQKPGKFEYSNFGMGLLGHVLEIVTGKDLENIAKEKLLKPLSMTRTSIQLSTEMKDALIQGYSSSVKEAKLWTFGALFGAGAFYSNVDDMMKFIIANIENKASITEVLKSMQQLSKDSTSTIGWMQPGYIEKFFGNETIVWHNGMVGGYASYIAIDQQKKIGVVVLTNKAIDVTMLGIMLIRQVRTQSWHR
ncbi:MAG: beta-lactamase family protein [Gammaproteobacteria bacterium]|nr:beta-lactamase family protein [Gammaproteobacteria bacterium]